MVSYMLNIGVDKCLRGVCMKISYKKLWMLLIQKDITKVQLRRDLGIAPGTMSKLNKGEEVAMSVLLRIGLVFHIYS